MSLSTIDIIGGPDAYLLEDKEKIEQAVILNDTLRETLKSRIKPSVKRVIETSDFIGLPRNSRRDGNNIKDNPEKRRNMIKRERPEYSNIRSDNSEINKKRNVEMESLMLPWEFIPQYLLKLKSDCPNMYFIHLNNEIIQLVRWLELTPAEKFLRQRILARIMLLSHTLWPNSKVQPFGSFFTGLSLPTGDLDICILNVSGSPKRRLRELADALRNWDLCTGLELILTARVPIIKFVDSESCISVDISLNQESCIDTTQHICECLKRFDVLRPLIITIKLFLHQRGLDETYLGGLGSYAQFCLILSFIQQHISSYSSVIHQMTSLGHLLFDFFELYGTIFNYSSTGIKVKDKGEYFPRKFSSSESTLSLESPLPPYNDIGRGTYKFNDVRQSFRLAFLDLVESRQKFIEIYSKNHNRRPKDPKSYSILSSIICTNDELFYCRLCRENDNCIPVSSYRQPPTISKDIIDQVKQEMENFDCLKSSTNK
ncbi:PAP/25A associated domain-containing protein [Cryptosporidium serpentis]